MTPNSMRHALIKFCSELTKHGYDGHLTVKLNQNGYQRALLDWDVMEAYPKPIQLAMPCGYLTVELVSQKDEEEKINKLAHQL